MNDKTAAISDMQHFSVGDGSGIRTTIFFKGCNLNCEWCHNPETISPLPTVLFNAQRCTHCGKCVQVCKKGLHETVNGEHIFWRNRCEYCFSCVNICPNGALVRNGFEYTVDEVMKYIIEDIEFYHATGGGVTFSGGEPLLQSGFCLELAKECRKLSISVILDTAGCVEFSRVKPLLPYIDEIYLDIKGADDTDYLKKTGGDIQLVLNNLHELVSLDASVTIRIPIIPDYNDSEGYMRRLVMTLSEFRKLPINLLPFHRLGSSKYEALGIKYQYANEAPPDKLTMENLALVLTQNGFNAIVK